MSVPVPAVPLSLGLLPFATVALSMIAITIYVLLRILPRQAEPPLLTQMLLGVSVLGGGSVLLLALLFVFLNPNGTAAWTWVLLAFNFMMMFPIGFWFVSLVLFEDRRIAARGWTWPLVVAVATTGSEVLMGLLFAVAGTGGALATSTVFARGLASVWLYWSMAAVMGSLIVWAPLSPLERAGSTTLALASVVAPWVAAFPLVGGIAASAVMAALFLLVARRLLEHRVSPTEIGFLTGLNALFLAMAVSALGLAVAPGADAAAIGFGTVMTLGMVGEVAYLVRRCYHGPAAAVGSDPTRGTAPAEVAGRRTMPLEAGGSEALSPSR